MFKNFIITLKRFTTSSLLNILGLGVAFVTAYLIMVQLHYDFSFNKSIEDADRVFLIEMKSSYEDDKYHSFLSRPVGEAFCKGNPSIDKYGIAPPYSMNSPVVMQEGADYRRGTLGYTWGATASSLDVLGVGALNGALDKLIESQENMALTESAAARLGLDVGGTFCFGEEWNPDKVLTVAAIIPDFPVNSDWKSVESIIDFGDMFIDNTSEWSFPYYIKLRSADDAATCLEVGKNKVREFLKNNADPDEAGAEDEHDVADIIRIVPISDLYFMSNSDSGTKGNKATSLTLLVIAILVIVIAFINFVNFFMAMVPRRLRGVNTHRVYGCLLMKMRLSILLESSGLVILALLVGWLLMLALQSSSIGDFISASVRPSDNVGLALLLAGASLLVALVAGVYPAYYITSFPLAVASKGGFVSSKSGQRLRMVLVGVQFFISISLIICSLFVKLQHDYMMRYDMGFNKSHLLCGSVPWRVANSFEDREAFAAELKKNPQIVDVAYANGALVAPGRMGWGRPYKEDNISFQCYPVSYNFLDFMEIKIEEGTDFSKSDEMDTMGVFIFNRCAQQEFGLSLEDRLEGHNGNTKIAGFCKDFNYRPLQYKNMPFAFYVFGPKSWKNLDQLYVRTAEHADIPQVISYIKEEVVKFSPNTDPSVLDFVFFDKELGRNYHKEQKLTTLIALFSLVSIIISLMGVFGLVLFETQYRRKEIGIRRVHGSSIHAILVMFNTQFVRIVLVCFVLAVPVSSFIMNRWLSHFAYHTPLYWWVFALALLVVLLITVVTVTVRSWRTAAANPVEAIKNE